MKFYPQIFWYYFIFQTVDLSVQTAFKNDQWKCNKSSKTCVRVLDGVQKNFYYPSEDTCRLICGEGSLWPQINGETKISKNITAIHPSQISFNLENKIYNNPGVKQYLNDIKDIFITKLFTYCGNPCKKVAEKTLTINVHVNSSELSLSWETNEAYCLQISTTGEQLDGKVEVSIRAETVFGIRHALETLSQLFASYEIIDENTKEMANVLVMISSAQICDQPIYKHRGLLLDTARNFMSIDTIKRQIVAMGASKLNVLHWHITDSHSFPLDIPSVPQFTQYGAYSKYKIYTVNDVKDLIEFALLRGIRILIELDGPAHVGYGWQWGPDFNLGDLAVCVNKQPWNKYCVQPPCGTLNPVNPNVYKVLAKLYKEVININPNQEAIHMGGDEIHMGCWNSTQEILNYLASKNMGQTTKDFLNLWSGYQSKATETYDQQVGHVDSKVILWTSLLTKPEYIQNYLDPKKYVIQTWVPSTDPLPTDLLQLGYQLIVSTKNAWYLDHGYWGGNNPYYKWPTVYHNRIPRHANVLGGEACMWSEYVDDNAVDSKVWPRTAAVAERLWSDPEPTNTNVILPRFLRHRERLVKLGVRSDVVTPEWCSQNEGQCNNFLP
ncbi:chitooligosaccharidolytic beta-N-acetylglucosaminidase [Chrysoperla carnea]|uniref:chitooligosaccharidolytic beta-N-acetylglucosaminidase n=1 Tax=Chrysoperla carnea TaxID=189513 RepID=UPI001D086647|nr:chitooligosaccharidolytic beta-N-acetylglucosaminidase [Chrysoperla carnea]